MTVMVVAPIFDGCVLTYIFLTFFRIGFLSFSIFFLAHAEQQLKWLGFYAALKLLPKNANR